MVNKLINGARLNDFLSNSQQNKSGLSSRKLSCELLWKVNFNGPLGSVFLSFDSRNSVTASRSGEVSVIDSLEGKVIRSTNLNAPLICAYMDNSTGEIFAFGNNSVSRIASDGSRLWHKTIQTPIINGALSQINKSFIICYEGNKIVIADYNAVPKYKGVIDSKGAVSSIYAPELSNNFTVVTTAGDVYYMNAYGSVLWQFCIKDKLSSVSMSRDGSIIFAGSSDNKVLCLHSEQKVLFNYELKSPVICTDISEDGKYFAVGCSDGYIYILDSNGNTVFYDRPLSCVSAIYLTEGAGQILTLSDSSLISMYKICERKTVEEKSKDFAGFIELDSSINFKSGGADGSGGSNNKIDNDFEKFIEL